MTWRELPYEDYVAAPIDGSQEVRRFGNCIVWSAGQGDHLLLILEENRERVTVCEYDSVAEFERDLQYLRTLPGDGPAGSGLPVTPLPTPPSLWARDARAMPVGDEELG